MKGCAVAHKVVPMDVAIIWLAVIVVLLIIEFMTLGLTTIWFVGGAIVALLSTYARADVWVQIVLFIIVSLVLLIFTRPVAVKYINQKREKTNYEGLIGKVVISHVIIDNYNNTGSAFINDVEWTARASSDSKVIMPGTKVKIVNIEGVKLIVEEFKEELHKETIN